MRGQSPEFGYQVPTFLLDSDGEPRFYWGARAIWHPQNRPPLDIDILPDRQVFECPDGERQSDDAKAFINWLNKEGIPAIRRLLRAAGTQPNERAEVGHEDVGPGGQRWGVYANPNASYGYLYIGAWEYPPRQKGANDSVEG